jgi:short-subunit dehydrogenase
MKRTFKDKVVIITGASSGIGAALAREFAQNGSFVVIAARSESRLAEMENELSGKGYNVISKVTDVSKEEDCRRLIDFTVERLGRIDILVNNAGISMKALFHESGISVLQRLMDVNFWGTVYCSKYALPWLIAGKGSLVAVSSVAGFHGLPGRSGYSASKFAIHGLLETIRIENLKNGLHVMIAAPGFTASEIRKHALLADGSEQGESPKNEKKLATSGYVAKKILNGIRCNRRNLILSVEGLLTALFQRIIPNTVDKIYYNDLAKEKNSPLK